MDVNLAVAGGRVLNLVHRALQAWPEGLHCDRGHTVATPRPLLTLCQYLVLTGPLVCLWRE